MILKIPTIIKSTRNKMIFNRAYQNDHQYNCFEIKILSQLEIYFQLREVRGKRYQIIHLYIILEHSKESKKMANRLKYL